MAGSNFAVFRGHALGIAAFLRRGSPDTVLWGQHTWFAATAVVLMVTFGSTPGLVRWHQFTFLLGLLLGIGVSLQNFYLLLFPLRRGSIE